MIQTDITIIGGGLAGASAATILGRKGFDATLIDPHPVYPADFRCEKLEPAQIALLRKTGLCASVFRVATTDHALSVACFGRVVETMKSDRLGVTYPDLVNAVRAEIPAGARSLCGKIKGITAEADRSRLVLTDGREVSARLVIVASGLNRRLLHSLGIGQELVSPCHSVTVGFDALPAQQPGFDFKALTYYPESTASRIAFLTFFPLDQGTRANFFVYRDRNDPWFEDLRRRGAQALFDKLPGLPRITGDFAMRDPIVRPIDLYVSTGHRRPGIVLIGDAFATACPGSGMGFTKVLTDVDRLCNTYIPRWYETPGFGAEKISAFYDDRVKRDVDLTATRRAFAIRAVSTGSGPLWRARRFTKLAAHAGRGFARRCSARLRPAPGSRTGPDAISPSRRFGARIETGISR
jgi:2-polyprenyl-6-methoxyphenol hydroxylase-like FAD-dependent oxidoreductase